MLPSNEGAGQPVRPRLIKSAPSNALAEADSCFHLLEYISGATYKAGGTNELISNFQKLPTASEAQLYYKGKAIQEVADLLTSSLAGNERIVQRTFVPAPGSKPEGHPEYDSRLMRALSIFARNREDVDARPILRTAHERERQKSLADRHSVTALYDSIELDEMEIDRTPVRSTIVLFDDVFTQGRTFKACQQHLMSIPGVERVIGLFIARTVAKDEYELFFPSVD